MGFYLQNNSRNTQENACKSFLSFWFMTACILFIFISFRCISWKSYQKFLHSFAINDKLCVSLKRWLSVYLSFWKLDLWEPEVCWLLAQMSHRGYQFPTCHDLHTAPAGRARISLPPEKLNKIEDLHIWTLIRDAQI